MMPRSLHLVILAIFVFAEVRFARAQVTVLDQNYKVSQLGTGLATPDGGMVYRPATKDFLVSEEFTGQIVRMDAASGAVSVFATAPPGTPSTSGAIFDALAINSKGEVFAPVYATSGPVLRFDASGKFLGSFAVPDFPQNAATFDAADNFYISTGVDGNTAHTIYEYTAASGYTSRTVFAAGFTSLQGLAFNASGQLFAADFGAGVVYLVTPGGTTASSHTVWASGLTRPLSIAVNPLDQSVFVGDYDTSNIIRITSPGVFSNFAINIFRADAIGFDPSGDLYAAQVAGTVWKLTNLAVAPLQISPIHGGNAGTVTVRITGPGLKSGSVVALTGSGGSINGTDTSLLGPGILSTTFNLTGFNAGLQNVTITNPNGPSLLLPDGFTVEQGGAAQVSVDIIGLDRIRTGYSQPFYISYANQGDTDIYDATLLVTIPHGFLVSVNNLLPTTGGASPVLDDGVELLLPIWIYALPAGSEGIVELDITAPSTNVGDLNIAASLTTFPSTDFAQNGDFTNPPEGLNEIAESAVAAVYGPAPAAASALSSESSLLPLDVSTDACPDVEKDYQAYQACVNQQQMLIVNKVKSTSNLLNPGYFNKGAALSVLENLPVPWGPAFSSANVFLFFKTIISASNIANNYLAQRAMITQTFTLDPNEKIGPQGVASNGFVSGQRLIPYAITFENSQTATAPVRNILIQDVLDNRVIDLTDVVIGPIAVAGQVITPTEIPLSVSPFSTTIDLRPANNLIVSINASLNIPSSTLQWSFASIDPTTGKPPTDPSAGFLPPGNDGSVVVTVKPLATAATGTVVQNAASIVFDVNTPVATPTWSNTLDNSLPVSHVTELPAVEASSNYPVMWSGTDVGSGIQAYTIYVSDNGGPFSAWQANIAANSATYPGQTGHTYAFYSIARDLVGNIEAAKTAAETSTQVVPSSPPVIVVTETLSRDSQNNVVANVSLANTGSSTAQSSLITVARIGTISLTPLPSSPVDIVAGSTTTLTLTFPASVGSANTRTTLMVGGTYAGGSFNFTSRITLP